MLNYSYSEWKCCNFTQREICLYIDKGLEEGNKSKVSYSYGGGGVRVQIHPFSNFTPDERELNFTPIQPFPEEKLPLGRWVEPKAGLVVLETRQIFNPGGNRTRWHPTRRLVTTLTAPSRSAGHRPEVRQRERWYRLQETFKHGTNT